MTRQAGPPGARLPELPAGRVMAPVQVRISGAPEDVTRLAEFLASLDQISASPVEVRNRASGIAQGYMTVILNGEGK